MLKKLLTSIFRIYQLTLSSVLGNRCRFYPTCSQYAIEAVHEHGSLKGLGMTAKRLSRCHPFCEGGYDPVPTQTEHLTTVPDSKA